MDKLTETPDVEKHLIWTLWSKFYEEPAKKRTMHVRLNNKAMFFSQDKQMYINVYCAFQHATQMNIQWGEQVFDTLLMLHVFLHTKNVEVCNFYHRYTSTVKDGI